MKESNSEQKIHMSNSKARNWSIMYIRVLAMLFIFSDHALSYMEVPGRIALIQITNSGVLIFLMISGFLYGGKTITNAGEWIHKRVIRLMIPYWFFLLVFYVLQAVQKSFSLKSAMIYFFALQGFLGTENGPGTLWFMTLLLMCYCLIPILQKVRNVIETVSGRIESSSTKRCHILAVTCVGGGITLILCQVLLAYYCNITLDFGHYLSWYIMAFFIFIFGYAISDKVQARGISSTVICVSTALMVAGMALRVVSNRYIDGTILYDRIISIWTNVILDVWIFLVVYKFVDKYKERLTFPVIAWLDRLSYPFYLVHATVLGYCSVLISGNVIYLIGFLLSVFFGELLLLISGRIQNRITKGK